MVRTVEKRIGVTAFKAKCLALVEEVASGKVERVILTRRGKPVAEVKAPTAAKQEVPDPHGCMRGKIWVDPDYDLTQPLGVEWDAMKGVLDRE